MIRNLINKSSVQAHYIQNSEPQTFFPDFNHNIRGRQNHKNKTHSTTVFAYEDKITGNLLVIPNVFQNHQEKSAKFIVKIESQQSQPCILITKQPILNKNDMPYFLLICKSKRMRLIQLCYVLGEAIYLQNSKNEVSILLQNLNKVQSYWKHRNMIILANVQQRMRKTHVQRQFGASTAADTRQLIDRERQKSWKGFGQKTGLLYSRVNSFRQNSVVESYKGMKVSQQMMEYFNEIKLVSGEVVIDYQSIIQNFQSLDSGLGTFFHVDLIPQIAKRITQASTLQVKYIKMDQIINSNTRVCLEQLANRSFQSYSQIVKMEFIQPQSLKLQRTRDILKNISESTIDSFNIQAAIFIEDPAFIKVYQELQSKITKQQAKILQLITKCNNEHSMRKFKQYEEEQFIDFDTLIGLEHQLLHTLFTDFQSYSDVLIKNVCVVFQQFFNRTDTKIKRKKKQYNFISSKKDKLQNLEERIVIYKQKKNALKSEVKLGQRQQQKLIEVIRGLEVETNLKKPDQFEALQQRFSQNRFSMRRDKKIKIQQQGSQF